MQFYLQIAVTVLVIVNVYLCVTEEPCASLLPCNCSETQAPLIAIDCHNAELNITEVCGICKTIQHVFSLDLSGNNFTNIPASCFLDCNELEELSLASNNLNKLTTHVFKGLKNLKHLNLDSNALVQNGVISDPEVFKQLDNLQILRLQKNTVVFNTTRKNIYLSNISNDSFVNLIHLSLDGLPNGVFGPNFLNFKHLTQIYFSGETSYCYMVSITNSSFQNVPFVLQMHLSHCNLSTIEAGTFQPLSQLRYLNLSYNMALGFVTLRNVSYGLQFTKTEVLDYSKVYKTFGLTTQLNRCDVWFLQYVTTLKVHHINNNRLSSIETNALALLPPSLEVITAEDNKLSFGPFALQVGCIRGLKRIELNRQNIAHPMSVYNDELYINEKTVNTSGGCEVYTNQTAASCILFHPNDRINPYALCLPKTLKSINFRSSSLRYENMSYSVPLPITNYVQSIDISDNIIYIWRDLFVKFKSLRHLNLSNNFCSMVSGNFFRNFPNIESLDASNNKIGPDLARDIDGSTFGHTQLLRILNLSNNWIDHLSYSVFSPLKKIESLCLSRNQITEIDFNFQHMKNLSKLYLQQNKISTLPKALLQQMHKYSESYSENAIIDLSNNELDGSCQNIDFLTWIIDYPHYFANLDSYMFIRSGHNLVTYKDFVESFSSFQKSCHQYTSLIIFSALFIMIFIIVIAAGIIFRYRWRIRYFYYMTKSRYRGYTPVRDSELGRQYQYDVFISYATENYRFVTGEMFRKLEEAGLQLCLHQKDFLPGNDIAENILQAIRSSKMTLIVLSPAFLGSKWCMYEFNMARMERIYSRDGENILFIVMYEDVDMSLVSIEMRECLESESYLAYPQDEAEMPYFWRMLRQALCGNDYILLE